MVSGGLVKMANQARKTSSSITDANGIVMRSYDRIKMKVMEVGSSMNRSGIIQYIRNARRELSSLERTASSGRGGMGGGLMGMVRSYIGPLAIAGGIAGVFGAGAAQEQNIVGLSTFLGKEGAQQAYGNIKKDAAVTPFSLESLLDVNRALITTGLSADQARKDTMNLANAIAASGKGNAELQRMAVNMQQIKSLGKATSIDIKQFAFAGINIYKLLADATGKTTDQVKEMDVSYELLSEALDKAGQAGGIFAGALAAQSQTVAGRWSTMLDIFRIGMADVGTALQPLMHGLLDLGMAIGETVVPAIISFVEWIKENWNWLSLLVTVVGAAFLGYKAVAWATALWTGAQLLLNAAMMANPIGLVVAGIAALIAGIIWAWNKFEGFRMVVLGMWEVFKQVFTNIGAFFKKIFEPIAEAIAAFKEGRYMDAAKAVGKMVFNLSPIGLAANAIAFAKDGGFTKGVRDAAKRGVEAGRDKPSNVTADAATPGGEGVATPGKATVGSNDTVKGITGGGPRVININGVKFTDKIEVHNSDSSENISELERKLEEMFLRVLNSGAALQ